MDKHQKHTKLVGKENDSFAPNEIALLGAKCDVIEGLVNQISEKLTGYNLAYFDASHNDNVTPLHNQKFTFHHKGSLRSVTNCKVNKFNQRIQFSQYDLVFINGNHYQGAKQILILDSTKESSVLKRLDQLTNIEFVIKLTPQTEFFDFLIEKNPTIKNLKCYTIDQIEKISNHIKNIIQQKIAPIKGLVLAGGKSTRMGTDKGLLNFYGKTQRNVAIELLQNNQLPTYLSVRAEQQVTECNTITDKFIGLGPFGAICSAFQENPNVAWLVLATDLPFVNNEVIRLLLKKRNPSKIATTIKGKDKEFPEPLLTIWEPKSYPILLAYLSQGYSCPRKVLINSDVEIVEVNDSFIRNINTPKEFSKAYKEINE